jgi:hypothetical protein
VLSPDSVASDNVAREVAIADNRHKQVVPILAKPTEVSGTLEYSLTGLQWVDLTGQRYERGLSELLEALNRDPPADLMISPARQRSGARAASVAIAAIIVAAVLAGALVLVLVRGDGDASTTESSSGTETLTSDSTTSPNGAATTAAPTTTVTAEASVSPGAVPTSKRLLDSAEVPRADASSSREQQPGGCGGTCYYLPENVLDGQALTAWSEGVDGLGVGQTLSVFFDRQHHLTSIKMRAGWQRSDNPCLFRRNGRPKDLEISFDTGDRVTWRLPDEPIESVLPVDSNTASVTMQIVDVYPGEVCDDKGPDADTLITDVLFEVDD